MHLSIRWTIFSLTITTFFIKAMIYLIAESFDFLDIFSQRSPLPEKSTIDQGTYKFILAFCKFKKEKFPFILMFQKLPISVCKYKVAFVRMQSEPCPDKWIRIKVNFPWVLSVWIVYQRRLLGSSPMHYLVCGRVRTLKIRLPNTLHCNIIFLDNVEVQII